MNILTEIIETADNIMNQLERSNFFEEYIFCDRFKLRQELEKQMQYNWEQIDDMYLNDEQFEQIIQNNYREGIQNVFSDLVVDGILNIDSVDANGELVYKLNPNIDIDGYLQSKLGAN
jgi:hypothetical protein